MKGDFSSYLRNFIFGVEDSLVSTVGLLSGVAAADLGGGAVILTGLILIFVEAFSMGIGSLLSDHSTREFRQHGEVALSRSAAGGLVMFVSYLIAGFIPLSPYLVFNKVTTALTFSIILSLIALFCLGLLISHISRTKKIKEGLQMILLGGLAIGLGVFIGQLVGR